MKLVETYSESWLWRGVFLYRRLHLGTRRFVCIWQLVRFPGLMHLILIAA